MWICPDCQTEVDQDWNTCWNCGLEVDPSTLPQSPPHKIRSRKERCPKCRSDRIINNAHLRDHTYHGGTIEAEVEVYARPGLPFLRGGSRSRLRARICGTCGYTEFYADDPEALWESFRESETW